MEMKRAPPSRARSSSREHPQNRDAFDYELSEEEIDEIRELSPGLPMRAINVLPALMRRVPL